MFFTLVLPFLAQYIALIAIGIAGIGITIFLRSLRRRSSFGMMAGGLIGVVSCMVAHGAGLIALTHWLGQTGISITPRDEYRRAFAFEPGEEVTQIRGRRSFSLHTNRQFLRFHAPPQTIATIVRGRFDRSTADECRRRSLAEQPNAPSWWTPVAAPGAECWVADPFTPYSPGAAWILYDPVIGRAHFQEVSIYTDRTEPDTEIQHVDVADWR